MASVGLMLYTVREECARDFEGTLREVSAMGYEGVEVFDLHDHEPGRVRGWLDDCGLAACGRHTQLAPLETRLPELAAECAELGTDRLVLAWIEPPASAGEAAEFAGRLSALALEGEGLGVRLGFHNHDGEVRPLEDGRSFVDELLAEEQLFLELDLGWTWYAGVDPVTLLGRARGRCPLVHVKDFRSRDGREFCPVGDGAVGYERVAPAAVQSGAEWLLVEQDETEGDALEAARRSLTALTSMLKAAA